MSGFDEIRMPVEVSWGSQRGPEYVTSVYENETHIEHRVARATIGRLRFSVIKDDLTLVMIRAMETFYRGRKGRAYGFRFKDWEDYQATNEPLVNGGASTLQLIKTYADAVRPEVRTIRKPVAGTVTLRRNAVPYSSGGGSAWTIDNTTGIITLTGGPDPGASFDWTGEFDVPVRFDTDTMRYKRGGPSEHDWPDVELVELLY